MISAPPAPEHRLLADLILEVDEGKAPAPTWVTIQHNLNLIQRSKPNTQRYKNLKQILEHWVNAMLWIRSIFDLIQNLN